MKYRKKTFGNPIRRSFFSKNLEKALFQAVFSKFSRASFLEGQAKETQFPFWETEFFLV